MADDIPELIISDLACKPSAICASKIKVPAHKAMSSLQLTVQHAKEQLLSDQVLSAISERYALLGKQSAPLTSRDVFQSQGNIHVKLLKTYIGALYRSYKLDLESEYGTAKTGEMIDQIGEWLVPLFQPLLREIQLKKDNEIAAGKDEEDGVTRSTFDLRKMTPKLLDDLRIAQHAHGATARLHEHLIGREGLHCPTYEYTPLLEQLFKVVCKVRDRDGQVLL